MSSGTRTLSSPRHRLIGPPRHRPGGSSRRPGSPRRPPISAIAVGAILAAALAAALILHGATSGSSGRSRTRLTPASTVHSFVSAYVKADGRVVRTDQGGDTVSEGQAYAMLMTAAVGDKARFLSVWGWTRHHLLLGDGLLAWHWEHGQVVGAQPASDADLGAAAALVMASQRFGDPALLGDARHLADAIVAHETASSSDGPTLVAGPWAVSPTEYVDPSYLAPAEMDELASVFGATWRSIASTSVAQLEALTARGDLPSDWAVVGSDHLIHPAAPPTSVGAPARFGFDALRAPVWMAVSCDAGLRASAAGLLPALRRGGGDVVLNLGGHPDPGVADPIGYIPLAAAEWAAGNRQQAWADLVKAAGGDKAHPTYYAGAWVVLTTLGFDGLLERCPA